MRLCALIALLPCILPAQSGSALLEEANAKYRAMRPAEAVRLYREYLADYPDRPDVRTYLGAALLSLGETSEAATEARRAIALDDHYAKAWTLVGRIHAEQRSWVLAEGSFLNAIVLDPGDRDAWYFLGRSYYAAGQFKNALGAFEHALKAGAGQSRVCENLGLTYEALDKPEEAEKAYRSALEQPDNSYTSRVTYGSFLFRQGRTEESLRILREAFRLAPDGENVRFDLALILYHTDELAEASSVLEPDKECKSHNLLARIYSRQGKSREAERELGAWKDCFARTDSHSEHP